MTSKYDGLSDHLAAIGAAMIRNTTISAMIPESGIMETPFQGNHPHCIAPPVPTIAPDVNMAPIAIMGAMSAS